MTTEKTHTHDPIIRLDGILYCRVCGENLVRAEKEICMVNSATKARNLIEEIALAGKYSPYSKNEGFLSYYTVVSGVTEILCAERLSMWKYRIFKRLVKE